MHLLSNRSLVVERPLGSGAEKVGGGTSLIRLFRSGDRTYVRRLDSVEDFGWAILRESERGRVWNHARHVATAETGVPERLITGVRESLTDANTALRTLYAELNHESGRQLTPPNWHLEVTSDQLTCLFEGASPSAFQRSTEQLARSLENLVLGSGYEVNVGEGRIEIGKKEK